jgi:hypothetical protein
MISDKLQMSFVAKMVEPFSVQSAPYVLFVVVAIGLVAIVRLRARKRRAAPASITSDGRTAMMTLKDAAAEIYDTAKRERMVIVTVAESAGGDAVGWFARSIAGVIPIYQQGNANGFEKLAAHSVGSTLESLYIRKQDYPTYVRWARSMQ